MSLPATASDPALPVPCRSARRFRSRCRERSGLQRLGRALTLVLATASSAALAGPVTPAATPAPTRALQPATPSPDVLRLRQWVQSSADHGGLPFIVIDKPHAHLWLFDANGALLGHTPVLLGLARGDHSVPGIGTRAIADIQPQERTTPAGRFVAESGRNLSGEDILWIDYDAAVSMHRVRATNPAERRLQRLASPTADDNRISYGCINVPAAFYDVMIKPRFWGRSGVVYLLPETVPLASLFGALTAEPAPAATTAAKEASPSRRGEPRRGP